MLRNNDGKRMSDEDFRLFSDEIGSLFDNIDTIKKYGFKEEDKETVQKFMFILQSRSVTLKGNVIQKAFSKVQNKIYYQRRQDSDNEGLTHFEKVLRGVVKKRYKRFLLGKIDKKKYTAKSILLYMINGIENNSNVAYQIHRHMAFVKKYTPFIKSMMTTFRTRTYEFKNTPAAKKFTDRYTEGYYKDKIDIDILIKYLVLTKKFQSTKEDLQIIGDIIDICHRTPVEVLTQYNDNEKDEIFNEDTI